MIGTQRPHRLALAGFILAAFCPVVAWQQPLLSVAPAPPAGIVADGTLTPQEWDHAPATPLFCDYQSGRVAPVQTRAWAAWNDTALYLAFRCDEPLMSDIKAKLTARDAPVWGEDCIEVFLKPAAGETYYHVAANPAGALFDERAQDASWNCALAGGAQRQAGSWTCELSIPWADLGGAPKAGEVWTANFTRARRATGEQLTCWSVTGGSFHNPQAFGKLLFASRPVGLASFDPGNLLPGVNHVRLRAAAEPILARLSTTLPRRALAELSVAAGQTAELTCELNPDDLRNPLEVAVLDATGQTAALQAFGPDAPLAPSTADIRDTLAKLEALAGDPLAQALQPWREAGTAAVGRLDAALGAARQAGRALTRAEWTGLAADLTQFLAECRRPLVWTSAPGATPPPAGPTGPVSVDIAMAVNERESGALYLKAPLLNRSLPLQVRLGELRPLGSVPGLDVRALRQRVSLLEAVPVPLRAGGSIADPLAPLSASGLFSLAPGETHELWVRVDSEGLAPGYYQGDLSIVPLDPSLGVKPLAVPLCVRVWDIILPPIAPLGIYVSDYNRSATSPEHLTDLLRHHVNILNANGFPVPDAEGHADLSRLGSFLEPVRGKGQIFMEVWFMRETGWRPQYGKWVRQIADEMERLGYGYGDWILQIYDETLCDEFLECCKQIKAVEPRLRIFSDFMGTPAQTAAFAPYVDIWCPFWADLNKQGGACLEAMRATGKPIWTYDCGGTKSTPIGRYRALAWVAWRYHLDGVYGWCYPGSAWDETPLTDFNYGHVYEGYRGEPIASKRWEAFGDGIEDLLLLRQYEAALGDAPDAADKELLAAARAFAEQCGGDPAALGETRRRIAHRLLERRGVALSQDFPRNGFPRWQMRIAGDGKGSAQLEPGGHAAPADLALALRTETERSWAFAAQPLEVARGQRVRLSLWARGKGTLRLGICEGFVFGGDPSGHRISERSVALTEAWQQVAVDAVVSAFPAEAFAGFDYGNAGAAAWLSDVDIGVEGP